MQTLKRQAGPELKATLALEFQESQTLCVWVEGPERKLWNLSTQPTYSTNSTNWLSSVRSRFPIWSLGATW